MFSNICRCLNPNKILVFVINVTRLNFILYRKNIIVQNYILYITLNNYVFAVKNTVLTLISRPVLSLWFTISNKLGKNKDKGYYDQPHILLKKKKLVKCSRNHYYLVLFITIMCLSNVTCWDFARGIIFYWILLDLQIAHLAHWCRSHLNDTRLQYTVGSHNECLW